MKNAFDTYVESQMKDPEFASAYQEAQSEISEKDNLYQSFKNHMISNHQLMNTTPNRIDLVKLWMETHFKGIPCVVFFDPLGDGERISLFTDKLGITCGTRIGDIINSDIFILPTDNPDSLLHKLPQDIWGFIMSWDGQNFTGEN